eukprot:1195823-Prorocentrum_minimum.AAC.17
MSLGGGSSGGGMMKGGSGSSSTGAKDSRVGSSGSLGGITTFGKSGFTARANPTVDRIVVRPRTRTTNRLSINTLKHTCEWRTLGVGAPGICRSGCALRRGLFGRGNGIGCLKCPGWGNSGGMGGSISLVGATGFGNKSGMAPQTQAPVSGTGAGGCHDACQSNIFGYSVEDWVDRCLQLEVVLDTRCMQRRDGVSVYLSPLRLLHFGDELVNIQQTPFRSVGSINQIGFLRLVIRKACSEVEMRVC